MAIIGVLDFETTGLSPWRNDRVVEIALITMNETGEFISSYESIVNPERDVGPSRIHKLTATDVLHAPKFADIIGDVNQILSSCDFIAGHNIAFDHRFLVSEYKRLNYSLPSLQLICTCQILGRRKLTSCCEEFGIRLGDEAHSAIADATATAKLLAIILKEEPSLLEQKIKTPSVWPNINATNFSPLTRSKTKSIHIAIQKKPKLLARIIDSNTYDTEDNTPNEITYQVLLDRVLEDRLIDEQEIIDLKIAIKELKLSQIVIAEIHKRYLYQLIVKALADGIITIEERADLHQVAILLNFEVQELEEMITICDSQLKVFSKRTHVDNHENQNSKRICFTGELCSTINGHPISRNLAETFAEKHGMVPTKSVTRKLDILVVADPNTQSGKAKKAKDYGIKIIAENDFWRMIGANVD